MIPAPILHWVRNITAATEGESCKSEGLESEWQGRNIGKDMTTEL
jgi:hypothetical protein